MALSGGLAPARASQGSHRVSGCGQGSPRFRHNSHASRATEHERRPAPGVQPWARGLSISSLYLPRATCPLPRSPNHFGAGRPSSCGASLSPSLPQAKSLSLCLWSLTLNVSVTWEKMKTKMPEENQARRFSARCTVLCVGASRGSRQGRGCHLRVAGLPWAAGCTASPVGRGRPGLGAERGAGLQPVSHAGHRCSHTPRGGEPHGLVLRGGRRESGQKGAPPSPRGTRAGDGGQAAGVQGDGPRVGGGHCPSVRAPRACDCGTLQGGHGGQGQGSRGHVAAPAATRPSAGTCYTTLGPRVPASARKTLRADGPRRRRGGRHRGPRLSLLLFASLPSVSCGFCAYVLGSVCRSFGSWRLPDAPRAAQPGRLLLPPDRVCSLQPRAPAAGPERPGSRLPVGEPPLCSHAPTHAQPAAVAGGADGSAGAALAQCVPPFLSTSAGKGGAPSGRGCPPPPPPPT